MNPWKTVALLWAVVLILIALLLAFRSTPSATLAPSAPMDVTSPKIASLEARVTELERQVKQLRKVTGLEGPEALPEGLQHKKEKR